MENLQALVDQGDPDELLLGVERLCAAGHWDEAAELARRCRAAVELGRQLWGVAAYIDYRLALEGPAPHAAAVLAPGASRFTLGPLTEVAAGSHDWDSLGPHLTDEITAATVAQERVIRGEDLRDEWVAGVTELPLCLQPWEPAYALPTYRDRSAEFPAPEIGHGGVPPPQALPRGPRLTDHDTLPALHALVDAWVTDSEGQCRAVCVRGDEAAAVGQLVGEAGLLRVPADRGIALGQWAAASGGAHGARRGGAAGRFAVWWALRALTGLDWPDEQVDQRLADDLGDASGELRWHRWFPASAESGWVLRLAVADPADGLAWAVDAADHGQV